MKDRVIAGPWMEFEEELGAFAYAREFRVRPYKDSPEITIHRHYFNSENLEIGYWCPFTNLGMIFETPRKWCEEFLMGLVEVENRTPTKSNGIIRNHSTSELTMVLVDNGNNSYTIRGTFLGNAFEVANTNLKHAEYLWHDYMDRAAY